MTYNINKQYTFSFYDAMLNVDDDYYKPVKYINLNNNDANYDYYESKTNKNMKVKQYLLLIKPHLSDLIDNYRCKMNKCSIQLSMSVNFLISNFIKDTRVFDLTTNFEEFDFYDDINNIITSLITSLINDYKNENAECGLLFSHISLFSYYVHRIDNKL